MYTYIYIYILHSTQIERSPFQIISRLRSPTVQPTSNSRVLCLAHGGFSWTHIAPGAGKTDSVLLWDAWVGVGWQSGLLSRLSRPTDPTDLIDPALTPANRPTGLLHTDPPMCHLAASVGFRVVCVYGETNNYNNSPYQILLL